MNVRFAHGTLIDEAGVTIAAVWAETPFGIMVLPAGETSPRTSRHVTVSESETITQLQLPGVDEDHARHLIETILTEGYLGITEAGAAGESLLFVVVNEALHRLEQIVRETREEDEENGD